MIQHDMMLFDHGMPRADGTLSPEQRPEADVNIEFQVSSKMAAQSQALAWVLQRGQREVRDRLPGLGRQPHDQHRFGAVHGSRRRRSACARTSAARRSAAAGIPHWHQPTDLFATYSDKDFRLGLNAAQTTLAAVAQLAGRDTGKATLKGSPDHRDPSDELHARFISDACYAMALLARTHQPAPE